MLTGLKEDFGLQIRSLGETNIALRGKVMWRMYKENKRPQA